jgi:hypothetical protein
MVDWIDVLRYAPLASAAAWISLAAMQVYRDRWHTWTETFFLFSCLFAAIYAIGDFLLFVSISATTAKFSALVSLTGLTLALNFFLLFTLVYVDRLRRWHWAFMAVSITMLLVVWSVGLENLIQGRIWVPLFNSVVFGAYLVYVSAYSVFALWNLYRLYRIVRESSKPLARRAAGLAVTYTLVLVLGLTTNGFLGITRSTSVPPPFSTLLIFVAASAYSTLYPGGRQRISEAVRRFQARRYSIKAVFLTYEDGTLIGSKARPGETVIDQDLFTATLDVIQNFMRTSFPMLRGKSLSAIRQGPFTLVMERGRYGYLTVILEGEESDQLRRQMRDLLLAFEDRNRDVLSRWQGVPSEAEGTDEMLSEFFVEAPLT